MSYSFLLSFFSDLTPKKYRFIYVCQCFTFQTLNNLNINVCHTAPQTIQYKYTGFFFNFRNWNQPNTDTQEPTQGSYSSKYHLIPFWLLFRCVLCVSTSLVWYECICICFQFFFCLLKMWIFRYILSLLLLHLSQPLKYL